MKISSKLLNKIRKNLEEKKQTMEKTLLSLESQDPFSDPDRVVDNAASDTDAKEESTHDRMEALERELKQNIVEINHALERINQESYGKCQSCGKTIDIGRLAIKPTALNCMDCKREGK